LSEKASRLPAAVGGQVDPEAHAATQEDACRQPARVA
jgi:hypothetical protein